MERTFTNFLQALRGAEVRVSVAETLDAMETAELMGWGDREALKYALSLALAKTPDEKEIFDATFDQFFRFDSFRGRDGETPEANSGEELEGKAGDLLDMVQRRSEERRVGKECRARVTRTRS